VRAEPEAAQEAQAGAAADGPSWFVHSVPVVRGNARNEPNDKLLLAYRSIKAGTDPKAKYGKSTLL